MATCRFYIKNPRTKGKLRDKELSIYAVFTRTKKERFPITLDEKILPRNWDFKNQRVRGAHPRHYEINRYLDNFKTELLNTYDAYRKKPFEEFKAAATKGKSEKKTLFLALSQFIEVYKSEKDSKTVAKFVTLERHLLKFDSNNPIDFTTLDFNFYDRFKVYLLAIPNPFYRNYSLHPDGDIGGQYNLVSGDSGQPVGIFDDNVYAYIVQLKTFIAWSERRGFQVNKAYKNWEVIRRVHPPITLTAAELEKLELATFKSRALEVARDYLVFECRTGQRISDIKRFELKDFSDFKWTFTPRKGNRLTQKKITVHFKGYCAPALEILQKYNWKMPAISEQKLNENIKRACKDAAIDAETIIYRWAGNKRVKFVDPKYSYISTHCGRKTFITLALQSGMPVDYVMQLTGITEYKTIRHYKGEFDDSNIEDYLNSISSKAVMKKAN